MPYASTFHEVFSIYAVARRYEFYVLVARAIPHEWAQRTSEILFLPLPHFCISLPLSCRIWWLLSNWRLTISPWLTVSCLQTTTHHQTNKTTTLSVRYIVMFNGFQHWPPLLSSFLSLFLSFKLWINLYLWIIVSFQKKVSLPLV